MDKARLILEQPCEHGLCSPHTWDHTVRPSVPLDKTCTDGFRTVLDPARFVELRRAVADWRDSTGPIEELHRGTRLADLIDALLSEVLVEA